MTDTTDKVVTFQLTPQFARFLEQVHREHNITVDTFNHPILALDPGETTGWATYHPRGWLDANPVENLITVSQHETKEIGLSYDWLTGIIEQGYLDEDGISDPYHIRCEDYRVYEWKTSDHAWSPVHTIRWIGAIQVAAHLSETPISFCMAQHAKGFWTDNKLNHFGINPKGLKHGRDALRHLLYYMLFPTKVDP